MSPNERSPFYKFQESDLKEGMEFTNKGSMLEKVKVLAVREGYVMAKREGKEIPFCEAVLIFLERINYIKPV